MLVFSTHLPLKEQISREDCLRLFINWVKDSPHYNMGDLEYDASSGGEYSCNRGNISFYIKNYTDGSIDVTACRLENRESDAVWINDCIFLVKNGKKSVFIQLNCERINYNRELPHIHKPYIVRQFVEGGYCDTDNGIPITDTALGSDTEYYEKCVQIMKGKYDMMMPAVYISCDYWGKTVLSAEYMAKKLSGIAHVFVERDYQTSQKLRKDTDGNNAYQGYVGVYYPMSGYPQKFGIDYYKDDRELTDDIINSIRETLSNRLEATQYNWNQIGLWQSRQKIAESEYITKQHKDDLDEYIYNFDQEQKQLQEKISELNNQVASLRAQLDAFRVAEDGCGSACFYNAGDEPELYPGEKSELLYNILTQIKDRYPEESRGRLLIDGLIEANPTQGECERIIEGIRSVLGKGAALNSKGKSILRDLGFTLEEDGPHYKMTFHDPRYMFSVPKTPGDHRSGKNLVSDICKIIDINKRL